MFAFGTESHWECTAVHCLCASLLWCSFVKHLLPQRKGLTDTAVNEGSVFVPRNSLRFFWPSWKTALQSLTVRFCTNYRQHAVLCMLLHLLMCWGKGFLISLGFAVRGELELTPTIPGKKLWKVLLRSVKGTVSTLLNFVVKLKVVRGTFKLKLVLF